MNFAAGALIGYREAFSLLPYRSGPPFVPCRSPLDGAPAILPVREMALRRQLEHWFESHRVQPRVVAEVEDTALLIDLGAQGLGFIPVYSAVLDEIERSSRLQTIGIAKGMRMEVFAITAQRRLQHPGWWP
jgi:LysR family transcriptional regulator, transcriptional activator of nhaA